MAHLGTLGAERPSVVVTFDYFGEQFTASPTLSDLDYIDFLERSSGMTPQDPASIVIVKEFGRACLAEGEFDRFWTLAKANRQTQVDVFEVLMKVLEAVTARPTESPSGSSDGQQPTETRSTDVSSSLEARLAGRPDLQLVVKQAAQAS